MEAGRKSQRRPLFSPPPPPPPPLPLLSQGRWRGRRTTPPLLVAPPHTPFSPRRCFGSCVGISPSCSSPIVDCMAVYRPCISRSCEASPPLPPLRLLPFSLPHRVFRSPPALFPHPPPLLLWGVASRRKTRGEKNREGMKVGAVGVVVGGPSQRMRSRCTPPPPLLPPLLLPLLLPPRGYTTPTKKIVLVAEGAARTSVRIRGGAKTTISTPPKKYASKRETAPPRRWWCTRGRGPVSMTSLPFDLLRNAVKRRRGRRRSRSNGKNERIRIGTRKRSGVDVRRIDRFEVFPTPIGRTKMKKKKIPFHGYLPPAPPPRWWCPLLPPPHLPRERRRRKKRKALERVDVLPVRSHPSPPPLSAHFRLRCMGKAEPPPVPADDSEVSRGHRRCRSGRSPKDRRTPPPPPPLPLWALIVVGGHQDEVVATTISHHHPYPVPPLPTSSPPPPPHPPPPTTLHYPSPR